MAVYDVVSNQGQPNPPINIVPPGTAADLPVTATQVEMEVGAEAELRSMSPALVLASVLANSTGDQGPAGEGVPTGGSANQILAKASGADYDTTWIDAVLGSGTDIPVLTSDPVTPSTGDAWINTTSEMLCFKTYTGILRFAAFQYDAD